ncbi:M55 family metallopeptidase [Streptomyces sp. NPDC093149]|uniref:M55 family metallopeptidase n=1 Tax=Streptomyces sp. NPDC093149 TaxID=3366031 RepID=UPI0038174F83
MGGIGLDAVMAGHMGVPVVLFGGDDAACAELSDLVSAAVIVAVEEPLGAEGGRRAFPLAARDVRGSSGCVRSLPAHSPRAGASAPGTTSRSRPCSTLAARGRIMRAE